MTFQAFNPDGARLGCIECSQAAADQINAVGDFRLVPLDSTDNN